MAAARRERNPLPEILSYRLTEATSRERPVPGWITAFKVIPWADVIAAAPTVARGAKKLWDAVRERGVEERGEPAPDSTEGKLRALEAEVRDLRKELADSMELINSLAQQNERLVEAVNLLRIRTRALLFACAAALLLLAALATLLLWS